MIRKVLAEFWHHVRYEEWREDAASDGPFTERNAWMSTDTEARLDLLLLAPLVLAIAAAIYRNDVFLAFALIVWGIATVLWIPWILWRVSGRNPPGDVWRSAATLAHAVWPWGLVAWGGGPGVLLGAPLSYVWGNGAMLLARRRHPPVQNPRQRWSAMTFGALVWASAAVACLWPVARLFLDSKRMAGDDGFHIILALLQTLGGLLCGALAIRLGREVVSPARSAAPTAA